MNDKELLEVIEQQADRIADLEAECDEMRDERDEAVALPEIELWRDIETVEVEAPIDVVVAVRDRIDNFLRLAKQMKATCDERIIAWIEQNGPLTVGPMQTKVVAYESETKCNDVPGAVEAVMATERGFAALGECLSVNALKPGACKKALPPEDYARLFTTTRKPVLKDGAPSKKLATANLDFVK